MNNFHTKRTSIQNKTLCSIEHAVNRRRKTFRNSLDLRSSRTLTFSWIEVSSLIRLAKWKESTRSISFSKRVSYASFVSSSCWINLPVVTSKIYICLSPTLNPNLPIKAKNRHVFAIGTDGQRHGSHVVLLEQVKICRYQISEFQKLLRNRSILRDPIRERAVFVERNSEIVKRMEYNADYRMLVIMEGKNGFRCFNVIHQDIMSRRISNCQQRSIEKPHPYSTNSWNYCAPSRQVREQNRAL